MEEYGPGEEALRAAAAAASREGNPEKLRGVQGMNLPPHRCLPPPQIPFYHSLVSLKLPDTDYICNFSVTDHRRFQSQVSHLASGPSSGRPPRPPLCSPYPSCLPLLPPEVSASSFSLHLLRPSRTLDFLCSSLVFLLNVCEHYSGELQTAK